MSVITVTSDISKVSASCQKCLRASLIGQTQFILYSINQSVVWQPAVSDQTELMSSDSTNQQLE